MSKSIKVLSIIGLVIFPLSFLCILSLLGDYDVENIAGWGIIASCYGVALSIVALVKNRNQSNKG